MCVFDQERELSLSFWWCTHTCRNRHTYCCKSWMVETILQCFNFSLNKRWHLLKYYINNMSVRMIVYKDDLHWWLKEDNINPRQECQPKWIPEWHLNISYFFNHSQVFCYLFQPLEIPKHCYTDKSVNVCIFMVCNFYCNFLKHIWSYENPQMKSAGTVRCEKGQKKTHPQRKWPMSFGHKVLGAKRELSKVILFSLSLVYYLLILFILKNCLRSDFFLVTKFCNNLQIHNHQIKNIH